MKPDDALEFFEILCSFIRRGVDDAKASGPFEFEEVVAQNIVVGIAHLMQHFKGSKLEGLFVDAWDGLCNWCLHFAQKYKDRARKFDHAFGILLDKATRIAQTRQAIGHNRSLLRYMSREWAKRYDDEDGYCSRNLLRLCSDDKVKAKIHNLILRYHGGFPDGTAEHIIKRIVYSAHGAPAAVESVEILRDRAFPRSYQRLLVEIRMMKTVRA